MAKGKDNKYRQARDEAGLTRDEASELMPISSKRIERIENGEPVYPDEVLCMARAYNAPDLRNYYCSKECPIGEEYVPIIEVKDLSQIAVKTLASLYSLDRMKERLVEICEDGKISPDELEDFNNIRNKLNEISMVASAIDLWIDTFIKDNSTEE